MKIDWFLHTPSRDFRAIIPVKQKFFTKRVRAYRGRNYCTLITDIEISLFKYTLEVGITRQLPVPELSGV
jgi:hypothetical protein